MCELPGKRKRLRQCASTCRSGWITGWTEYFRKHADERQFIGVEGDGAFARRLSAGWVLGDVQVGAECVADDVARCGVVWCGVVGFRFVGHGLEFFDVDDLAVVVDGIH